MDLNRAEGLVYPLLWVNILFPCHVRAELLSLVFFIPSQKLFVTLFPGRRKKVPHILWLFFDILLSFLYIRLIPKQVLITYHFGLNGPDSGPFHLKRLDVRYCWLNAGCDPSVFDAEMKGWSSPFR